MYVHALEGSWFDHPFWRSKFLLTDPADLQTLRGSGVKALWIDVEKGVDVETATPAAADAPPLVQPPEPSILPSDATISTQQCSVDDELQRASRLLKRSKEQVTSVFNEARLGKAVDPQQCQPLVEQISASLARNGSALLSLARLKTKDEYTYMHSVAVCALMVALARQLDLPEDQVHEAGMAGLLHDIGKMAMPLDVLNKPGKLSDDEYAIMRSHPERGHAGTCERERQRAPHERRNAGAGDHAGEHAQGDHDPGRAGTKGFHQGACSTPLGAAEGQAADKHQHRRQGVIGPSDPDQPAEIAEYVAQRLAQDREHGQRRASFHDLSPAMVPTFARCRDGGNRRQARALPRAAFAHCAAACYLTVTIHASGRESGGRAGNPRAA